MSKYRMLLVEELVESDSGEFIVEAASPEVAAAILITAHAARDDDSNIVRLPDGQECEIDPNGIIESRVFCVLLDDTGKELHEVEPDYTPPTGDDAGGSPS